MNKIAFKSSYSSFAEKYAHLALDVSPAIMKSLV